MWLTCSSVGRKLVMAITGACLVLFVTFHCLMNGVALFWPAGYNAVCEFLGANWYALIASIGLAVLFIIHIIYALWLTVQNRRARGNDRYVVTARPEGVEWSSQNMFVLGLVVLAFLVVHLIQFWARMQLVEVLEEMGIGEGAYNYDGMEIPAAAGTLFLNIAFSQIWTPIVYVIGFVALWFHMNHGFWSMFQSIGWDNDTWLPRLKCISWWWTTIVVALFLAQVVVFTVRANTECFHHEYMEYMVNHGASVECDHAAGLCPEATAACDGACDKACDGTCEKACEKACDGTCEGEATVCSPAVCGKASCLGAECNPEACGNPACKGAECNPGECGNPNCAK